MQAEPVVYETFFFDHASRRVILLIKICLCVRYVMTVNSNTHDKGPSGFQIFVLTRKPRERITRDHGAKLDFKLDFSRKSKCISEANQMNFNRRSTCI